MSESIPPSSKSYILTEEEYEYIISQLKRHEDIIFGKGNPQNGIVTLLAALTLKQDYMSKDISALKKSRENDFLLLKKGIISIIFTLLAGILISNIDKILTLFSILP